MHEKIKFIGDLDRINEEERNIIDEKIGKFVQKHDKIFDEMYIKLDCHMDKETSRGRPSYTCKVHIVTDHGKFHAENKDFGGEKTISKALDKITRQIQQKK